MEDETLVGLVFWGFVYVNTTDHFRFRLVVFGFWILFSSTLPNASACNAGGFRAPLTRRSVRNVFPFGSNVSDKDVWKKSSPNDIMNVPTPNFLQTITKLFLFLDKFTCFLKKRLLQLLLRTLSLPRSSSFNSFGLRRIAWIKS